MENTTMNLDEMRRLVEMDNLAKKAAAEHEAAETHVSVPEDENTTSGLIIDAKPKKEANIDELGVVSPATMTNITKYMNELDEDIEKAQEMKEQLESEDVYSMPAEDEKVFNEKYNTAAEVIIKTGVGTVLDFTPEERAKMEKAKTIRLEEIETKEIKTLKTKRLKKSADLQKIVKRTSDMRTTPIVLPLSGYTATMAGCSGYELMTLIDTKGNPLTDMQNKWSTIHSKIVSTSIGKMDFNTFLHNTAASDYNNFVYGILCATYPNDDKIPVTCPNDDCKTMYDHPYSIRSLIRVEEMSDKLRDSFMAVADASISIEAARECHEKALINTVKSVVFPMSEYIAEIYVQTAYDLINRSIKTLSKDKDNKYAEAAVLSTMVNRMIIPDPEDPETPYEIDNPMELCEIIYGLSDVDLNVLHVVADDLFGDMVVNFGLMNVKCPNCGHFTPTIPMELENLLFYKYRQVMNMTLE